MAFGVRAHRDRLTVEHFSEDDQSQLDKGKKPGPEHKRQPDLNDHSRSWTYPGVSIHFALLPDGECDKAANQMPRDSAPSGSSVGRESTGSWRRCGSGGRSGLVSDFPEVEATHLIDSASASDHVEPVAQCFHRLH